MSSQFFSFLVSISSTFYTSSFCANILVPKITKLKHSKRKLGETLSFGKLVCKMLMKLITGCTKGPNEKRDSEDDGWKEFFQQQNFPFSLLLLSLSPFTSTRSENVKRKVSFHESHEKKTSVALVLCAKQIQGNGKFSTEQLASLEKYSIWNL